MFSQASVSHCVHNWPHSYSVTAHHCYVAVGTHSTGMLSCYYYNSYYYRMGGGAQGTPSPSSC